MGERTIDLNISKENMAKCHLMPCRIEFEGSSVKAEEYFWPTIKKLKDGSDDEQGRDKKYSHSNANDDVLNPILTASFRGRPLQGRKIKFPDDYHGYVLGKPSGAGKSSEKVFKEFTYWNWDELPSKEDSIVKALQWINVSNAIHSNVS